MAEKASNILRYIIAYENGGFVDFNLIAVDKRYRNLGVGKLLIGFVLARFKKRGFKKAFLEVRQSNKVALSFYQNLGFKIVDTVENYYKDGGAAYRMEKIID